ncbi:hypothetical protein RFI_24373 [Reticulomyxa filosa]|uniref:Fe2OG dioxygenase domain-containing protein n=1 Tax=Reticulomyxa filosa TaxID=46433 RepID=X6MHV2_RETFI|nr:hypothetical protein RFI_24373 [Reticulomyxa filosa]|eukprot:ETO13002.1 hypothetical protein RFI_24373 [Reticulomyxa filosa]
MDNDEKKTTTCGCKTTMTTTTTTTMTTKIEEKEQRNDKEEHTNEWEWFEESNLSQNKFPFHLLDETFIAMYKSLIAVRHETSNKIADVISYWRDTKQVLKNPLKGVWIFPVFNATLCANLIDESEHYLRQAVSEQFKGLLPIQRPNSMNGYGLVVNAIGMKLCFSRLMDVIVAPLSDLLLPFDDWGSVAGTKYDVANSKINIDDATDDHKDNHTTKRKWEFNDHHTFVIRYKHGEDVSLDTHVDASLVTLNICLGKQDFEGAKLYFHSIQGTQDDLEKDEPNYVSPHPEKDCPFCRCTWTHEIGHGVLHIGKYIHGANTLKKGERNKKIFFFHVPTIHLTTHTLNLYLSQVNAIYNNYNNIKCYIKTQLKQVIVIIGTTLTNTILLNINKIVITCYIKVNIQITIKRSKIKNIRSYYQQRKNKKQFDNIFKVNIVINKVIIRIKLHII